ncbi:MAG: M1 family metallopeptidase [Prochlorothrix sp.]|nr:M1 family metallopeptidase [Prochlorothrix sp.]
MHDYRYSFDREFHSTAEISFYHRDTGTSQGFELPGARPHYSPDRPGQVNHIRLDLSLDLAACTCEGTCTIRLTPVRSGLESLSLDAVNQTIQAVSIAGVAQHFDYDGEKLEISLDRPTQRGQVLEVVITYRLDQPQRGLYFIQPTPDYPQKPVQAWTQGEDEDSRYWFPCLDYPGQLATSEIRVSVPADFMAVSNGELIETLTQGDRKIYHWSQTQVHPTYLMTLAVGRFVELQDTWRDRPITYYVEAGREEDARRSMGKTPEMVEFFSHCFGYAYPFPKYAQVCVDDFIFGGMENTSTTLLTDRCLLDERAMLDNLRSETLVAHELAHQWFGDLLVIRHWSHAWLKEGMATYAETLWINEAYGPKAAAYYQLNTLRSYLEEDRSRYRRPIVTHVYREPIELYDRHLYEKGGCVYHLLRHILGEEAFWDSIHTFVQDNAHKTVETVDLLRAIEKATGRNLLSIFDQYVFRGGHPDYKVSYSWDKESKLAKVTVKQTQAKPENQGKDLFDLRVDIALGWGGDTPGQSGSQTPRLQTFTVRIHEAEQSFYFPLDTKPEFISFDPGNAIPKTVTLEYPLPLLKAQLALDPDPVSRILAAEAIAKRGGLEAVKILETALKTQPFWGVRREVARCLGRTKLNQAQTALIGGLEDSNPWVRSAVVSALGRFKTLEAYQAIYDVAAVGDASYGTEANAIATLATFADTPLTASRSGEAQEVGTKDAEILELLRSILEKRAGWNEAVRSGAMRGLSQLKTQPEALELVLAYTVPGIPQALRLTAIRALGAISTGQKPRAVERILERLEDLGQEEFFLTQMAVIGALRQMETPAAIGLLSALIDQTLDGRSKRSAEEAIKAVEGRLGDRKAMKGLQDEVKQLKQHNQELRSRLEALEAKSGTDPAGSIV